MQTSAKTKAKEFWKRYNQDMNGSEYDIYILEQLLLEHERDTRYTAIDIVNSEELLCVDDPWNIELNGNPVQLSVVEQEPLISKIHNLKVGEQ